MKLKKIRVIFKDSLNFIQLPLSSFKKAFDLDVGKFDAVPLRYNTAEYLENKELIPRGAIPPLSAYILEGMSTEKINELKKWHLAEAEKYALEGTQYDVAGVIEEYCTYDVITLLRGFQKFRIDFAMLGCKEKKLDVLWAVSYFFPTNSPFRTIKYYRPLL